MTSHPLLRTAALTISAFPIALGSLALLNPHYMLVKMFEFPLPPAPADQKVTLNQMRSFGIRDTFVGAACLGAWYRGDDVMLGFLVLMGAGLAVGDGFAQRSAVRRGQWTKHWVFVPVLGGVGLGLMGGV
ncbi:hypothetical protein LTR12_006897 [Friedmanniomyces endolithicus]|nr:hypothetical protein LTR12_006897 [Friedmanniomyces endolithicus]